MINEEEAIKEIKEKLLADNEDELALPENAKILENLVYTILEYRENILNTVQHFAPEHFDAFKQVEPILFHEHAFWGCDHIDHSPFEVPQEVLDSLPKNERGYHYMNEIPVDKRPCYGKKHSTVFCLNMNDVFETACSDSEQDRLIEIQVNRDKWFEVAEIYNKFGYNGLVAWASIQRKEPPASYINNTEAYKAARTQVEEFLGEKDETGSIGR